MKKEIVKKYFHGDLVRDGDLDKVAKQRRKGYKEITVPKAEKIFYLKQGWKLKKQFINKVRLQREKDCGELLEDKTWLLFKNMGFAEMNKDRNFKIKVGPIEKQISVFAKDDSNVFIIFCTAREKEGPDPCLRKEIHEILNLRKDIEISLWKHYKPKYKLRISFLLVTKNILWSLKDEEFISEKDLFFWKEGDIGAYINLTNQLRKSARFQMYSILFFGKEIPETKDIEVPAIYGGKGENKYYSFIIQPEKLLKIAYVHRREESSPEEVSGTYQRMLKRKRLNKICEFINKGGFFPNSIVLNFTEEPVFEKKDKAGDIVYGILKFPKYYGSAWVIDGQHRLYGYSETERKATDTLPVVAFVKLKNLQQAKLFVEINREQTAVGSNLLWDLYPDIYYDVEEEKYQILRIISLIVKKLNLESDSPLYKHIYIPSIPKETGGITNLTMASICDGIKDNKLIDKEERLLYDKDYDYTVGFAGERIKVYFNVIAKFFSQDWKKGNKGLFRTNIGIRIFLIILRQLLRYLNHEGLGKIYRKKNLDEFEKRIKEIIGPVLIKLKKMSGAERDKIRKGTSKGKVLENAQMLLWDLKEKLKLGQELWRKGGWAPPIPDEESDENIEKLIKNTEKQVMTFIIEELKRIHREKWWISGIPEGVKQAIKDKIEKDKKRFPFKREKISSYSDEKKLTIYSSISDLREIIRKRDNWLEIAKIFGEPEYTSSQFTSLEIIRNAYVGHEQRKEEVDEIEKNLGYWGMKWIRKCIGLDKTEKKA